MSNKEREARLAGLKIQAVAERGYATKSEVISIMASLIEDKSVAVTWSAIWDKALDAIAIGGNYADQVFAWEKMAGNAFKLKGVYDGRQVVRFN